MLANGTTFIWDGHIWFNLTEPTKADRRVLCVNLTTLDDECPDDECFVTPADYCWVEHGHPTVVAFSRAKLWDADKIEGMLNRGLVQTPREGNIPKPTLAKISLVGSVSRELSADFKKLI